MSSTSEYSDDEEAPPPTAFEIEPQLTSTKYEKTHLVRVYQSAEILNYAFLVETGFDHPMVFRTPTGLGLKIPNKRYSHKP